MNILQNGRTCNLTLVCTVTLARDSDMFLCYANVQSFVYHTMERNLHGMDIRIRFGFYGLLSLGRAAYEEGAAQKSYIHII